jgi:hypothetical protein
MAFSRRMALGATASLVVAAGLALASPAASIEPALLSRLSQIESAFRRGDARALRGAFPAAARTRLELRDLPSAQGSLGAGQVEVLFRQIFEARRTAEFAFARAAVRLSPPSTAFARARWVRKATDGAESVDTLTFTLRAEGDDWRIEEIRSTR